VAPLNVFCGPLFFFFSLCFFKKRMAVALLSIGVMSNLLFFPLPPVSFLGCGLFGPPITFRGRFLRNGPCSVLFGPCDTLPLPSSLTQCLGQPSRSLPIPPLVLFPCWRPELGCGRSLVARPPQYRRWGGQGRLFRLSSDTALLPRHSVFFHNKHHVYFDSEK